MSRFQNPRPRSRESDEKPSSRAPRASSWRNPALTSTTSSSRGEAARQYHQARPQSHHQEEEQPSHLVRRSVWERLGDKPVSSSPVTHGLRRRTDDEEKKCTSSTVVEEASPRVVDSEVIKVKVHASAHEDNDADPQAVHDERIVKRRNVERGKTEESAPGIDTVSTPIVTEERVPPELPRSETASPSLPSPWTIQRSRSSGKSYFYNTDTKESSWTQPQTLNSPRFKNEPSPAPTVTPTGIRIVHLSQDHSPVVHPSRQAQVPRQISVSEKPPRQPLRPEPIAVAPYIPAPRVSQELYYDLEESGRRKRELVRAIIDRMPEARTNPESYAA